MLTDTEKFSLEVIDDKEYLEQGDSKSTIRIRVFTLDNGMKLTINLLADKLQCHPSCARARLNTSSDPKRIFKKVQKVNGRTRSTNELAHLMDSHGWFEDPLVKLMLK
tara:strand:- start:225 stop:548 length:324 start_codon:yes stop_codon:yes gene_type:complete